MNNFKCAITNKQFFIPNFRSKVVDGQMRYYDVNWNQLVNPQNGEPLVRIQPDKINLTQVKTDTALR